MWINQLVISTYITFKIIQEEIQRFEIIIHVMDQIRNVT